MVKLARKQVQNLHIPIYHVDKSLASINEKTFYINFSSIVAQSKKQKKLFSYVNFFDELLSTLVNASIYFNYDFDLICLH